MECGMLDGIMDRKRTSGKNQENLNKVCLYLIAVYL